jgi:hypothetical protein
MCIPPLVGVLQRTSTDASQFKFFLLYLLDQLKSAPVSMGEVTVTRIGSGVMVEKQPNCKIQSRRAIRLLTIFR